MTRANALSARLALGATLLLAAALPALHAAKAKNRDEKTPAPAPAAAAAKPIPLTEFEAFRPIVDRNIFNPGRTGRSRATEEVAPKVDSIALVGTMQSDQGVVAVFDGSTESWRTAVPQGGRIADFTVGKITPASVELTLGDKTQVLRMSQQLRRQEGGEWRISGRDLYRGEMARREPERETKDRPAAPAIPTDANDIVRRLMEQRQKQLKQ